MKTEFKKSETNFGCYVEQDNAQDKHLPNEDFTIYDVLNADVLSEDKIWFILNNCELNTDELSESAIECAWIVLPIFEEKFNHDKAPRKAIEAAQDYLDGKINLEELEKAKCDADFSAYAVDGRVVYDVANANYYAAAARASRSASCSASRSVSNAVYYANSAAYYADNRGDTKYQDLLLQYLKDFFKETK